MIRISELKLPVFHKKEELEEKIRRILKYKMKNLDYKIAKRSLDARHKEDICYIYTIDVTIPNEEVVVKKVKNKNVHMVQEKIFHPFFEKPSLKNTIVVGSGPAGLFCSYILALNGCAPLLIERGGSVDERKKDVEKFWEKNELKEDSNVLFGEGGAGTFSDGKLNTGNKDKFGYQKFMLETFVKFGAPKEILYLNKPHIGTDYLRIVVKNMREEIKRLGGSFRFHTKLTDIDLEAGKISAIEVNNCEKIRCENLILAIGHSARDTFKLLKEKGFLMEQKPFACGLRIEHPREMIDQAQYGEKYYQKLPAADYKFVHKAKNGRNVFTFCMCPGGMVVNASSEKNGIVVNGMSNHERNEKNSNAAIVVNVTPDDFSSNDVLAGIEFQRTMEQKAYELGNGSVPVQLFGDYLNKRKSGSFGKWMPNIKGETQFANLWECLPNFINDAIIDGIMAFDKRLQGFSNENAILSGVETRTSSPVRILRNSKYESNKIGIYPCGEGAGYAGGITSAAVDGIKTAIAVLRNSGNEMEN